MNRLIAVLSLSGLTLATMLRPRYRRVHRPRKL